MTSEINRFNLERVQSAIELADSKANYFLALTLAFLTGWSSLVPRAVEVAASSFRSNDVPYAGIVLCVAYLIFAGLSLKTLQQLLLVVSPRLHLRPTDNPAASYVSNFYFETIARQEAEDFIPKMVALSDEEAARGIADQTHRTSYIASEKFLYLKTAIFWMTWAGAMGLVFAALAVILSAVFPAPPTVCVLQK